MPKRDRDRDSNPTHPAFELDRRTLLRAMLGGASSFVLPQVACSSRDDATTRKSRHSFVFYYLMGGWDITLLTEPSMGVDGVEVEYEGHETFEHGGYRWGPAMAPLKPYMDQMAVIRGIRCEALNHPQARFQMVTGKFRRNHQPPSASAQTMIAEHLGGDYVLPNLSSDTVRPASFLGDLPHHYKPMRISNMGQLGDLTHIDGDVAKYQNLVAEAIAHRDAAFSAQSETELAREFQIYADLARAIGRSDFADRALRAAKPRFTPNKYVKKNDFWGKQAHLAIEVVRQDLAPIVTVGAGSYDCHMRHQLAKNRNRVRKATETVAAICEGLGPALEHTTVVVWSEFSREPRINELGGTHHWAANSLLLIGKGVKKSPSGGPIVFNECDERVFGMPIDPTTGSRTGRGVDDLLMTHGLATILAIAGIDPVPRINVDPIIPVLA